MSNEAFEKAWQKIKTAQNIIILTHKDADGDTLGSAFGLKSALVSIGKNAEVWCEETTPHKLFSILKGASNVNLMKNTLLNKLHQNQRYSYKLKKFAKANFHNNYSLFRRYTMRILIKIPLQSPLLLAIHYSLNDIVVSVDSADPSRLGQRASFFQSMGENTIAFDHHKTFTHFAHINYVDPSVGACAEVIYKFIKYCQIPITPDVAHNLYIGLSSDTGGFRQSNTTAQSMEIGADLMRHGANVGEINTALFLSNTLTYTKLTAQTLQTLQTFHNNEIAILHLTQKMLHDLSADDEGTEGIINFARNIIGVKIAFFLREKLNANGTPFIKISARSNDDKYDVSKLCARFDGGGHLRAAGGEFAHNNMPKAIAEVIEQTISFIENSEKLEVWS